MNDVKLPTSLKDLSDRRLRSDFGTPSASAHFELFLQRARAEEGSKSGGYIRPVAIIGMDEGEVRSPDDDTNKAETTDTLHGRSLWIAPVSENPSIVSFFMSLSAGSIWNNSSVTPSDVRSLTSASADDVCSSTTPESNDPSKVESSLWDIGGLEEGGSPVGAGVDAVSSDALQSTSRRVPYLLDLQGRQNSNVQEGDGENDYDRTIGMKAHPEEGSAQTERGLVGRTSGAIAKHEAPPPENLKHRTGYLEVECSAGLTGKRPHDPQEHNPEGQEPSNPEPPCGRAVAVAVEALVSGSLDDQISRPVAPQILTGLAVEAGISEQPFDGVTLTRSGTVRTLRIKLLPEDLGSVEVSLRRRGSETSVHISVTTPMAAESVLRDISHLEGRIADVLGIGNASTIMVTVDSVSVPQDSGQMMQTGTGEFATSSSGRDASSPRDEGRPSPSGDESQTESPHAMPDDKSSPRLHYVSALVV